MANNEFRNAVDFLVDFLCYNFFQCILFHYFPQIRARLGGFLWRVLSVKCDVILRTDLWATLIFLFFSQFPVFTPPMAPCLTHSSSTWMPNRRHLGKILKLEVFEFPMSQFVDNVVYVSLMCKFQKPFQNGLIFGRPISYDEGFSSNRLHLLGVRCEDSQRGWRTALLTEVFEIRASLQPML